MNEQNSGEHQKGDKWMCIVHCASSPKRILGLSTHPHILSFFSWPPLGRLAPQSFLPLGFPTVGAPTCWTCDRAPNHSGDVPRGGLDWLGLNGNHLQYL